MQKKIYFYLVFQRLAIARHVECAIIFGRFTNKLIMQIQHIHFYRKLKKEFFFFFRFWNIVNKRYICGAIYCTMIYVNASFSRRSERREIERRFIRPVVRWEQRRIIVTYK